MRPTLPIGTPYVPTPQQQPNMRIPEPATLVGDRTGKRYVNVGDNPQGPEAFNVIPPAPAGPSGNTLSPASMANGGTAIVGDESPTGGKDEGFWDHVHRLWQDGKPKATVPTGPASMAGGGTGLVGDMNDPNYDPLKQQQQSQSAVTQSQYAGEDAQQQEINARANYYQTVGGTVQPTQQEIAARGNVVNAQVAQNTGSRALIQATSADTSRQIGEQQQLQAAARNTPDLQAVAQAQTYRDDQQIKNSQAGVSAAQEYIQPEGDKTKAPAGTLAKIQTQGDVLGTRFANADKLGSLNLELEKSGVDLMGNDVAAATAVAAKAGLTLDAARALVTQSEAKWGMARAASSTADNNTARIQTANAENKNLPSDKVAYQDPVTGASRLVTPAEKQTLEAQNQRDFNVTQPGTVRYADPDTGVVSYKTQAEADQLQHDYEQRKGLSNATQDANYQAARQPAQNAAQNALDVQYTQNPNSAPAPWIVSHVTIRDPKTGSPTRQGVLSEDQAMTALINQGFSAAQAYEMIRSGAVSSGFGSGQQPGG